MLRMRLGAYVKTQTCQRTWLLETVIALKIPTGPTEMGIPYIVLPVGGTLVLIEGHVNSVFAMLVRGSVPLLGA